MGMKVWIGVIFKWKKIIGKEYRGVWVIENVLLFYLESSYMEGCEYVYVCVYIYYLNNVIFIFYMRKSRENIFIFFCFRNMFL